MRAAQRALALALLAWSAAASAAATPAAVRAEIDALLLRLADSGCSFRRGTQWHAAAEARSHLLRKLAAAEQRGQLTSTEQFIDTLAARSSSSGQPYAVRCAAGAAVQPSAIWLHTQLLQLRQPR